MKQILFGMAIVAVFVYIIANNASGASSNIPAELPDFTFQTTDEQTFTKADLQGTPTLVYFFGEGCPPCVPAGKAVLEVAEENKGKLRVIGAEIWDDSLEQAKRMKDIKGGELTYVAGAEPLAESLGITGVPTLLFIDAQGNVQTTIEGFSSDADIKSNAAKLIKTGS